MSCNFDYSDRIRVIEAFGTARVVYLDFHILLLILSTFFIKYHVTNNTEFFSKYKNLIPYQGRIYIRSLLVKTNHFLFNK